MPENRPIKKPKVIPLDDQDAPPDFDPAIALTRLVLGGAVEGMDQLVDQLKQWEGQTQAELEAINTEELEEIDRLRYALIGFVFESQVRLREEFAKIDRDNSFLNGLLEITDNPILRPLHDGIDQLSKRIEADINRWVHLGQAEEQQSRAVARQTIDNVMEDVIDYLARNPDVRDLIQQQSVGIMGNAVDNVRTATTSGDELLERIARRIFGRAPRTELRQQQLPPGQNNRQVPPGPNNGDR